MKRFAFIFLTALLCMAQAYLPQRRTHFRDTDTPPVTSNLMVLLDAERDDATYNDNDAVGTLTDWSGNSYSPTAAGGARPTFKTGILNSRAVYRFDGTDDTTDFSGGALGIFNNQGGGTYYVVVSSTYSGVAKYPFYCSTGSATTATRLSFTLSESGGTPGGGIARGRRLDGDTLFVSSAGAAVTDGSYNVWTVVADWANSNIDVYRNGASYISSTSFQTDGSTSATDSLAMKVGSYIGANFLNGDIAWLGIYRGAHGTSDRESVEDWLGARFNITITH